MGHSANKKPPRSHSKKKRLEIFDTFLQASFQLTDFASNLRRLHLAFTDVQPERRHRSASANQVLGPAMEAGDSPATTPAEVPRTTLAQKKRKANA